MPQCSPSDSTMDTEEIEQGPVLPSRGRSTSKLKVLGRSHAMREEQSPPREPTADPSLVDQHSPGGHLQSPPTLVLSPSPAEDDEIEPDRVDNDDSSAGITSQNNRCSSNCDSNSPCERLHPTDPDQPPSPKFHLKNGSDDRSPNHKSSQAGERVSSRGRKYCECQNQNCIKCLKEKSGSNNHNNNNRSSPNMLFVNKSRGKLKQQSSSQNSLSFESSTGNSSCLSRESSSDCYTDTTGVDLEQFIPETLNRNPKDRALMLRIEEELVNLANDKFQTHYKFPPMSSYHRMLVHRCAAYFGMDHNIEQSGKCVIVNKTKNTRIPDTKFKEHIKEIFNDDPPRRSILKRDSNSIEDYCFKSPERGYSLESRRSKSFEEREEEYEKARRRIFRQEMHDASSDDFGWSDVQWSSTDSDYPRYRLHPPDFQNKQLRRLLKGHSEEVEQSSRPCVAKSYSFGGYGGNVSILTRGDSIMSTHSAPGARLLTKQDSGASSVSWRLSPSSSGYKSQSQLSESVTPSPTSTPHPPGDAIIEEEHDRLNRCGRGGNAVVWAVTDMSNVPKGSIIINPENGKPFKNDDGSIYHYDPNKPHPKFLCELTFRSSEKPPRPCTPDREKTPTTSPKHEKRLPAKSSPVKSKCNFTNTATSPSLPFSPPLSSSSSVGVPSGRNCPYMQVVNSCDGPPTNVQPTGHFQQFSGTATENSLPVYQQPFIIYTPYGMPVQQQFDNRMEQTNLQEINTTYFVPEGSSTPAGQGISYQPTPSGPFWNQQPVSFYPTSPQPPSQTPPQRFSVHMQPTNQTAFVPSGYTTAMNYVGQTPSQPAQNAEVLSVYPNQTVQMMYPPSQHNSSVIYQNQPLVYSQNLPLYPAASYPIQNVPLYPQGTPTPNSCNSSMPSTPFPADNRAPESFVHLTQGMHQMSLGTPPTNGRGFVPVNVKCTQFDPRRGSLSKMAPGQAKQPRPFLIGSGQSSAGTNSPAATVIAGYCPTSGGAPAQYRTPPPSTPPTPQFVFHQPGFPIAPRIFRQLSSERGTTPNTAKSSRSPTPASDITHFDRQRYMFPTFYPGVPMPYIVHCRGQPNVYNQTKPINTQNSESRSHNKNRKSKGNKSATLPPSGK